MRLIKYPFLMLLTLVTVLLTFDTCHVDSRSLRYDDICGEFNGRRLYLELEERGVLVAKIDRKSLCEKRGIESIRHNKCSLELLTCPSCVVNIKFSFLNLSRNCGNNAILESCGCDYIWIYEPPFEDVSGQQYCGHFIETNLTILTHKSQTRSIAITFLYSSVHEHAFTLEYISERNIHVIDKYPTSGSNINNTNNFIVSSFFPHSYPRDLSIEYVISCKVAVEVCRIRLDFTDFQISDSSLIEFFDSNGQRMYVTTGSLFRPPVLISTGPKMIIRFYANGGSNLGYKAIYGFLIGEMDNNTLKPDTDCGGFVDNLGGGITMMNMIKERTRAYDCFWIIRPPESYLHHKTHVYLKVINFSDFVGSTELIIRQGVTSVEPAIETIRYRLGQSNIVNQKEHVVPISQGFYVSLKGLFGSDSRLSIVYSTFSYTDCFSGSDFQCHNQRCIPIYLNCDGFDHCGDNSDEPIACIEEPRDRIWSHTPNFFFPKIDRFGDLKVATIVFVICSFGLISLIFILILLLYRVNSRSHRSQGQLQSHLQTINNMLEEGSQRVEIEEIFLNDDEPPSYEAPPDYEEALKIGEKPITIKRNRRKAQVNAANIGVGFSSSFEQLQLPQMNELQPCTSLNTNILSTLTKPTIIIPNSPPPTYSFCPIMYKITNIPKIIITAAETVDFEATYGSEDLERTSPVLQKFDPKVLNEVIVGDNQVVEVENGRSSINVPEINISENSTEVIAEEAQEEVAHFVMESNADIFTSSKSRNIEDLMDECFKQINVMHLEIPGIKTNEIEVIEKNYLIDLPQEASTSKSGTASLSKEEHFDMVKCSEDFSKDRNFKCNNIFSFSKKGVSFSDSELYLINALKTEDIKLNRGLRRNLSEGNFYYD